MDFGRGMKLEILHVWAVKLDEFRVLSPKKRVFVVREAVVALVCWTSQCDGLVGAIGAGKNEEG